MERAALGTYLLLNAADLDRPAGDPAVTLDLVVVAGETAGSVVSQLQAEGVVENGRLLSLYLRYRGLDVGIEAGRYFLSGGMTPRMIAELLQTAEPRAAVITVIEGWRREQIAPELAREGLTFDPQDFLEATEMPPASLPLTFELPAASSLEGFLFPDTYRLDPETTVEDLVSSMLENFDRQVTP
ncbi:MAG: hypothetical protein GTN65_07940, partial [Armatimonadetes bacterium]|nr:hypothetical protein [Armatimonadota bacterium]NIO97016.1 hypothetical protein [Armatimonadota bacterium]